jgi:hypothetical protein
MMRKRLCCAGLLLPLLAVAGCGTDTKLTFRQDVYPILQEKCLDCHSPPNGKGYKISGLNMESYETVMQGNLYGPVVVPGDSLHSVLIMFVEGRVDETILMPHEDDEPLNTMEIATLRTWVEQGATKD